MSFEEIRRTQVCTKTCPISFEAKGGGILAKHESVPPQTGTVHLKNYQSMIFLPHHIQAHNESHIVAMRHHELNLIKISKIPKFSFTAMRISDPSPDILHRSTIIQYDSIKYKQRLPILQNLRQIVKWNLSKIYHPIKCLELVLSDASPLLPAARPIAVLACLYEPFVFRPLLRCSYMIPRFHAEKEWNGEILLGIHGVGWCISTKVSKHENALMDT